MEILDDYSKSGVLPQIISKTGAKEESLQEVIICSSISGGAKYVNNMPKELTLIRKLASGKEFTQEYNQV